MAVEAVEIRNGGRADVTSVLQLWRSAGAVATVSDHEAGLTLLLERDPEALLVATLGGTLVGSLVAGWDGWRGALYRVAVAPDVQRRGTGRALVRAAEARFAALGAPRAITIVVMSDGHAVTFWEAIGYTRQAEVGRFVRNL